MDVAVDNYPLSSHSTLISLYYLIIYLDSRRLLSGNASVCGLVFASHLLNQSVISNSVCEYIVKLLAYELSQGPVNMYPHHQATN